MWVVPRRGEGGLVPGKRSPYLVLAFVCVYVYNKRRSLRTLRYGAVVVSMNRLFRCYRNTVRRRIRELMSGSCLGCLLEIEHTCSIDYLDILQHFDSVFNRRGSERVEGFRLRVLESLLAEVEPDEEFVTLMVVRYQEARPYLILREENKENIAP